MKKLFFIAFLFINFSIDAQVTNNPRIRRKSTDDVFINKVEITGNYTVFSMQYNCNTHKESLDEYINRNPALRLELMMMPPLMRDIKLLQLREELKNSSEEISFKTTSFIQTTDGKRFRFVRVEGIPAWPDNITPEFGKKYYFKVYFEKLPKGYELIDLLEDKIDHDAQLSYWNFAGVEINNPDDYQPEPALPPKAMPLPTPVPNYSTQDFRLFGRVLDAVTNKPIQAKMVCAVSNYKQIIDSVVTSKSGSYEFLVNEDIVTLKVSANGYQDLDENINLKMFRSKGSYSQDVFLEPKKIVKGHDVVIEKPAPPKVEPPKVEPPKPTPPPVVPTHVGTATDDAKSSFKLDKVYFAVGQADILPESHEQLDGLVTFLKENSNLKIQIEGHTDNLGDHDLNQKLSLDRAFNVRQYLIDKGINGNRIKFMGYGDTKPITHNKTEESRKLNRRVEFKFID